MSQSKEDKERAEFLEAASEMYEELRAWRRKHPEASFDEIAGQVTPRRRELMGKVLDQLATQQGEGEVIEGLRCPACGRGMIYKGNPKRGMKQAGMRWSRQGAQAMLALRSVLLSDRWDDVWNSLRPLSKLT